MKYVYVFLSVIAATVSLAGAERNVVLFVVDDQGSTDAGCYGNTAIKTPNLDRIATAGTRYTNAFCTTASCSASRSVILTGLHNHANGQYGHQHSYHHFRAFDSVKSLPVLLGQKGYRTARIGKYHVAPESVFKFDHALEGSSRNPVQMARNCESFVKSDDERPFFLYFCTSDPHRGGGTAKELPHAPDRFGNRPQGYAGVRDVKFEPDEVIVPPYLPDTPACRAELAQYYQSVERIDQGIGALVSMLRDAGVWDDTLFMYISDNGIAFPGAKTTLYDPGMRLPCIVRSPYQKKRGVVSSALVSWVDITPTILDFARATPEKHAFHGRSFLPTLEAESAEGWNRVYASHTFHEITMYYPMRVVRTSRYKLIWNIAHGLDYPFASDLQASATWQNIVKTGATVYGRRLVKDYLRRPRFELYDIEKDPHEVVNLAGDAKHAATLEKLKASLKTFQERTRDPWRVKWEYE